MMNVKKLLGRLLLVGGESGLLDATTTRKIMTALRPA